MNANENNSQDFNRRDFLKGGSLATLMTMLGGVELVAGADATSTAEASSVTTKVKVGVIGLGAWGRELVNTLAPINEADVAAVCDTYPAFLRRGAKLAPKAAQTNDYKTILADKEITAVVIATPTHHHKDLVLEALKAGKHVYCEAPLATTIEDARTIATAAKAAKACVFQAGLQFRADPQRHFLIPFIRSGAIGQPLMARAQFHKKQTWRATAATPEREKELNWRLDKATSVGLIGELGCHSIDQAGWFINGLPKAVTGWGSLALYNDGRDVPDTAKVVIEFPKGVIMNYDATLANSFDGEYEMLYGTDAAVLLRDGKAWMFKEVDSPLLGWEVYATKETFYKETGIVLKANASKAPKVDNTAAVTTAATTNAAPQTASTSQTAPAATDSPLSAALTTFLRNCADLTEAAKEAKDAYGDDAESVAAEVEKARSRCRPAAGYLEGYQSAVVVIKCHEAVMNQQRIELKPEWYELG